jgi:hypothetical protein
MNDDSRIYFAVADRRQDVVEGEYCDVLGAKRGCEQAYEKGSRRERARNGNRLVRQSIGSERATRADRSRGPTRHHFATGNNVRANGRRRGTTP